MYLCASINNGQCEQWVEYSSIFLLPEGVGLQIGGALLLASITAWGVSFIARSILNR